MRRRVFLSGAATAGVAALGLPRGRPAHARGATPGELLARAGVSPLARFVSFGAGAPDAVADVPLVAGATARRGLGAGGAAAWSCALRALPVRDPGAKAPRPDAVDLVATFRLERGAAPDASVGLGLVFARWSVAHYVVMPGAVYAANRFESRHIAYPPLLAEEADIGPHVPAIVSDIPRLNVHAGPSRLEVLATDLATPAVGVQAPDERVGLVALVDPATRVGPSGLVLEESDDRARATLMVLAPGGPPRDDPSRAAAGPRPVARGAAFRARDELVLRVRLFVFDCADVPPLFERLAHVRKDLTGPTARPHELPFSAAFAAHEARVNRTFVEDAGYFAVPTRDADRRVWHSGWAGGFATTLPLATAGDEQSRARARRTLDFAFREGQAPSGFFHSFYDGRQWLEDGPGGARGPAREPSRRAPRKRAGKWHLVRRSADALTFALKLVRALERLTPGVPADAAWMRGIGRCADAFVHLWDRERQLGQYVDVDTGEIVVGGSTAAALAPAGLALAAAVLKRDDCLAVASAAAQQMYERSMRAGVTSGGPGDALQCPDGESAAALLESFMTLFEQTGDSAWLERATAAAVQVASWVISYDVPAGADAAGAPPVRATGAVFSNVQNMRGAPGYTLLSGDALLRLYRATGETRHLELLRDTVHNLAQYLPRVERAAPADPAGGGARRGRADPSGWLEDDDDLVPARAVFDASAMLSYTEVPGVYVRTDTAFVFAFDHVDARVRERGPGRLVVTLENPTSVDAAVRILAESEADAARPLAPAAVLTARVVGVPAGGAADVAFDLTPAASR
jgi:hypothetical protein